MWAKLGRRALGVERRQALGHHQREPTADAQHAFELEQRAHRVGQVLDDVCRDGPVVGPVVEHPQAVHIEIDVVVGLHARGLTGQLGPGGVAATGHRLVEVGDRGPWRGREGFETGSDLEDGAAEVTAEALADRHPVRPGGRPTPGRRAGAAPR